MKLADSKVPVVDKKIMFRSLLTSTLDPVFEVDFYQNRSVELQIPRDTIPDINVRERDNPKPGGFHFLKEIRNLAIFKDFPFIGQMGIDIESSIYQYKSLSSDHILSEPCDMQRFKGKVIQSFQKRNQGIPPHY